MTNKKNIIHEVDASKCIYFKMNNQMPLCKACNSGVGSPYCEHNKDCYYKQLQRAEKQLAKDEEIQVDMRLKIDELYGERNVLNTANGALNNLVAELEQKLFRKEQECEELKDKLNCCFCNPIMGLDDIENFKKCVETTECFRRQLDQLKEQLEAYKMEAEEGKEINAELKADNEKLRNKLSESLMFKFTSQDNEIYKLKQAIEKIKEIAKFYKKEGRYTTGVVMDKILKICDEVNDEQ